ncbi:pitrilysin family protein [uncultured Rikenella sp.]|uniref:M16 family metallopeptidase n=1 Tax=uncultured Rikenella sp. TaxID=368003 RepID=UPI0026201147|nr:pitrilysin family protein [uncultured Rikenella sp.]
MLDRTIQPPFQLPDRLDIPAARQTTLPGGIRLWTIDAGTQPLVRLSLVFGAGTRYQPAAFAASTALNLMSEGTARYSAARIAEKFDYYGIYYDTSIDRDYSIVTVSCLSRFLDQALELLGEILFEPLFPERELEIYASKRKQQLIIEREKPSYQARELFAEGLFGKEHPYGQVSPAAEYDKLTVDTLRSFYETYYRAGNVFAVASGQIGTKTEQTLAAFLERFGAASGPGDPGVPPTGSTPLIREKREGALQSSIRIGKVLFPKGHPDFNGLQVAATVLGGYFGSRLVKNLREDKGYTYGIYSAMLNMQHSGYFAVASDVTAAATDEAVAEILKEVERLRTEPVPQAELDMVRNIIVGEMMRILDGPFGIADVTIENVQCGMTNQALSAFFDEVRTITPQRIRELAAQWLDPATFTTVIVGA